MDYGCQLPEGVQQIFLSRTFVNIVHRGLTDGQTLAKESRKAICVLYSQSKAKKVAIGLSVLLMYAKSLVVFSFSSPCKICLP